MLTLACGEDRLILAPEDGARITSWTSHGAARLADSGCFPMLPYCNRIAYRHFSWAGATHDLTPNFGGHPHTIHGTGWRRPWTVEHASPGHAALSLSHDPDGDWPFAFTARLVFALTASGLTITMEATNRAPMPVPMGLGLHPYFPRVGSTRVSFAASGVWTVTDSLPDRHGLIPPAWSHVAGRDVSGAPLDHCFTGWDGRVSLPGLTLSADRIFGNLQVFTPSDADFFCVEPVTHVPDAINRKLDEGQGMAILERGQSLRGDVRLMKDT